MTLIYYVAVIALVVLSVMLAYDVGNYHGYLKGSFETLLNCVSYETIDENGKTLVDVEGWSDAVLKYQRIELEGRRRHKMASERKSKGGNR